MADFDGAIAQTASRMRIKVRFDREDSHPIIDCLESREHLDHDHPDHRHVDLLPEVRAA